MAKARAVKEMQNIDRHKVPGPEKGYKEGLQNEPELLHPGTGSGYSDYSGLNPHKVSSPAGTDGVNCPAAGAFKLNSGPSSAKKIVTPLQKEKEDDIGNASCFHPNTYEETAC